MCNASTIAFGLAQLGAPEIEGKRVIEIGSRDVNGSLREGVMRLGPREYIGVDLQAGPGVDVQCNAACLVDHFGEKTFDVVLATAVLEHIEDWRTALSQFKRILRPYGILLLTMPSIGFPFHSFPFDYWRFEPADMDVLLSDMVIEVMERDSSEPGVFVLARRPTAFVENDLSDYALYSIIKRKRAKAVSRREIASFALRYSFLAKAGGLVKRLIPAKWRATLERKFVYSPLWPH